MIFHIKIVRMTQNGLRDNGDDKDGVKMVSEFLETADKGISDTMARKIVANKVGIPYNYGGTLTAAVE